MNEYTVYGRVIPMKITQDKVGRKYVETGRDLEASEVYKQLANRLISKKICKCSWIKSIARTSLYNGFQKIVVTYDNNTRDIFIVQN